MTNIYMFHSLVAAAIASFELAPYLHPAIQNDTIL